MTAKKTWMLLAVFFVFSTPIFSVEAAILDAAQTETASEKIKRLEAEVEYLKGKIASVESMTQEKISVLEDLVRYMQSVVENSRLQAGSLLAPMPNYSPDEEKIQRLEVKVQRLHSEIERAQSTAQHKISDLEHLVQALREVLNNDRSQVGNSVPSPAS